jgi:NitT/TauT family transport system ATP-binding protein
VDNPKSKIQNPKSILILDRVSKSYGDRRLILDDISLTISSQEFVAIVGASGCGKSTLLQVIAGLIPSDRGAINWGQNSSPRLSFVFQEAGLMPWANVVDNVALPLRLMGKSRTMARASAKEAIEIVGLPDVYNYYPFQLSGGMKMRVSLARALVTQPEVLLMDEPFGALDEISRTKLNGELLDLSYRSGWTTIFVTHNIYEAVYLADRVLVMSANPGRICAEISIDVPRPRSPAFRLSPTHTNYCQQVESALIEATPNLREPP